MEIEPPCKKRQLFRITYKFKSRTQGWIERTDCVSTTDKDIILAIAKLEACLKLDDIIVLTVEYMGYLLQEY